MLDMNLLDFEPVYLQLQDSQSIPQVILSANV